MAASNPDCAISQQLNPVNSQAADHKSQPGQAVSAEAKAGQLLVDSGVITREQLDAALVTALEYKQPLTKILSVQHNVAQIMLKSAEQAQSMIDGLSIEREVALEALKKSHSNGLPFNYLVARTESQPVDCEYFSDLERILFESKIVTSAAIKDARAYSADKNVPIGSALYTQRHVQFAHLNYVFECLHFVDRGWLTKTDAIRVMSIVNCDHVDLKTALEQQGFAASNMLSAIKLGDLLLHTKLIDEANLLAKLEESILNQRLLGTLLLESELIDQDQLVDALIMQNFCAKDLIDNHTATKILRKSVEGKRELAAIANEYNLFRDDPLTAGGAKALLLKSGLLTLDQIDQAEAMYYNYGMDCLHATVAAGFVSPAARTAAVECSYLLLRNLLTEHESILVLQKCNGPHNDLQEEFQLLPSARRQEHERALEQAITDGYRTNSYSLRPRLFKSVEFLLLTALGAVIAVALAMSVFSRHFNTNSYSFTVVTLIAGIAAIQIGLRWRRRVNAARFENELKAENAKDTVKRLSHSKRKLA